VAVFVTFVLVGTWHGAGWNFVLFGVLHGVAVVFVTAMAGRFDWLPGKLAIAATFIFFVLSLVLFRSADASSAATMYAALFNFSWYSAGSAASSLAISALDVATVSLCAGLCFLARNSNELADDSRLRPRMLPITVSLFILSLSISTQSSEFIYFNF
jgi:D-alanyl-lipoteichoic acid acyltransferase DltB (MBOAT superfamily)